MLKYESKHGQFIHKNKIYSWVFTQNDETVIVKHGIDEIFRFKLPYKDYPKLTDTEYFKPKIDEFYTNEGNSTRIVYDE